MDSLHTRALSLSRQHRQTESELVAVLGEIEEAKLHRTLGYSSLFSYAVSALGLSESVAYALIAVARKAREVGALRVAVAEQKLSVQRASRIVAALTVENAEELIGFAITHTQRETDQEVSRLTDRLGEKRENLKISLETLELLRKAQAVMASRRNCNLKLDEALKLVLKSSWIAMSPCERPSGLRSVNETLCAQRPSPPRTLCKRERRPNKWPGGENLSRRALNTRSSSVIKRGARSSIPRETAVRMIAGCISHDSTHLL